MHFWIMTKKDIQVVLKHGHFLLILVTSDFDYVPGFPCWPVIDKK